MKVSKQVVHLLETRTIGNLNDLEEFCRDLLTHYKAKKLAIYGELGAGKTTMVKLLGNQLGIATPMTSPTFGLLNEYEARQGMVYHFDLYRLVEEEELLDLGFEEYLSEDAWVFIEWPELVDSMLPHDFFSVFIELTGTDNRQIKLYGDTCGNKA